METNGGRRGTGHSPKTLRNKYGFLSGALGAAVPKLIPANPCAGRRLPRFTGAAAGTTSGYLARYVLT